MRSSFPVAVALMWLASPQGAVGFSCGTRRIPRGVMGSPRDSRPLGSTSSASDPETASSHNRLADLVRGGQAELLLSHPSLASYFEQQQQQSNQDELMQLAETCRRSYLSTGIAHIPHFVRDDVVQQMVHEAIRLRHESQTCFYSTERHTVYQEPHDPTYSDHHPRNALQHSSKWIMDYARLDPTTSPLVTLYTCPHLKAFVSYVVRPPSLDQPNSKDENQEAHQELFYTACPYNAAYYNIYETNDGLGWHFDRSEFGVNLELSTFRQGRNL